MKTFSEKLLETKNNKTQGIRNSAKGKIHELLEEEVQKVKEKLQELEIEVIGEKIRDTMSYKKAIGMEVFFKMGDNDYKLSDDLLSSEFSVYKIEFTENSNIPFYHKEISLVGKHPYLEDVISELKSFLKNELVIEVEFGHDEEETDPRFMKLKINVDSLKDLEDVAHEIHMVCLSKMLPEENRYLTGYFIWDGKEYYIGYFKSDRKADIISVDPEKVVYRVE